MESKLQLGFIRSKCVYSVFTKTENEGFVAVLVYADDIMIDSSNKKLIEKFKSCLQNHFKLKDLGTLQYFLGLEVARSGKGIAISQRKFVSEFLEEYGLLAAKPSSVLFEVNAKLMHFTEDLLSNPTIYRQLIGKLMYVQLTRPNIPYSVHVLSQFMDKPTQTHLNAAYKILKYLKNAPRIRLVLSCKFRIKVNCILK